MADNTKTRPHLAVKQSTKDLILKECVQEFIEHHPEFEGFKISQDFICQKIARYYLEH